MQDNSSIVSNRDAVQEILGETVAECYLCMLQDGTVVPVCFEDLNY